MLYDDYLAYTIHYQSQYGKRTVVLMEVGSFFELYAVENEDQSIKEGPDLREICSILNIQSTRKNKAIAECSRSNPMMAGFPSHVVQKFMELLVAERYTVVLVEQVTPPPHPERKVTQIISPSTYMDTTSRNVSHRYIMCWYLTISYDRKRNCSLICCHASAAELSTGETIVLDPILVDSQGLLSEGARLISAYGPQEIVIVSDPDITQFDLTAFWSWLNYVSCSVHNRTTIDIRPFLNLAYQQSVLRKVYSDTGLYSPIEYVQLERDPSSVVCFTYLIQFVYEHNESLVQTLRKPSLIHTKDHMVVTHTSLEQLHIIPRHGQETSLYQLMNTCVTAMGQRMLKDRFIRPLTSETELRKRYATVKELLQEKRFQMVRKKLSSIKDIERLFRRIQLKKIQPCELVVLYESLVDSLNLWEWMPYVMDNVQLEKLALSLRHWIDHMEQTWEMDRMKSLNWNQVEQLIIRPGKDSLLDEYQATFQSLVDRFNKVVDFIRPMEEIKLERTVEKREYQLIMTKKRYDSFCDVYPKGKTEYPATPLSSSNKTTVKLAFSGKEEVQEQMDDLLKKMKERMNEFYSSELENYGTHSTWMESFIRHVSELDVMACAAQQAYVYRYVCPEVDETPGDSYIEASSVRHPIIERLHTEVQFVGNDVSLGKEHTGMLLYGINFSGKSSYMKSVGVNLLLAQTGFFVAADSFRFRPYHHIFTRIPSGDNLFKGQSTFVVEMNEVRSILQNSTSRSLVIGDEVASGTETISGIAIVASTILTLAQRRTSFLFATHLHEVAEVEEVKSNNSIGLFHMAIHYDQTTKLLCYDRQLRKGTGSTMYGLEVCQSLDMPSGFLHLANTIRQQYLNLPKEVVLPKSSSYQADVFVDRCSVCAGPAEEVHHLQEQHKADSNGFIGAIHKNHRSNVTPLCASCHDKIHAQRIKLDGHQMTSQGVKLMITIPDEALVEREREEWRPKIQFLRDQGKSWNAIALELGITNYKVQRYMK